MNDDVWYYVGVRADQTSWPQVCPCCLDCADAEMPVGGQRNVSTTMLKGGGYIYRATGVSMKVPSCAACNDHRKKWHKSMDKVLLALLAISVTSVLAVLLGLGARMLLLIPLALLSLGIAEHRYTRRILYPQCISKVPPVRMFPAAALSDVSEFGFLRKEYADLFSASNSTNVVERGTISWKTSGWTKANVIYYGRWAEMFGRGRSV